MAREARIAPSRAIAPVPPGRCDERKISGVIGVLRQLLPEVLGVFFMLREELETSLQQALELFVLGGGDQLLFERPINGLMVGHLVLGVSHIEGVSAQLRQLFPLFGRRIGQGFAGAVILWLYLQLIEQRERLFVYRFVIPDHLLREGFDILVLTLAQRLLPLAAMPVQRVEQHGIGAR